MNWVDLAALALAARAALDVWLSNDSILVEYRAVTQTWRRYFWRTLFNCRKCLSYWIPVTAALTFYMTSLFLPAPWDLVAKMPVYCWAATALVHLLDRLSPPPESGGASTEHTDDHRATAPVDLPRLFVRECPPDGGGRLDDDP